MANHLAAAEHILCLGADCLGTAPLVTVGIRGPIKGYIEPYYKYYPTVTEGRQY